MFGPETVFQRTHAGRSEIHDKKAGLTQSERLVLIMIDGTTAYSGVRAKLPVLAEQRFERAVQRLLQKELISEVFMPVEGMEPEVVERSVIDRFLQQDPLDPVTIMMIPEDERLEAGQNIPLVDSPPGKSDPEPPGKMPELRQSAIDADDAQRVDEIGEQARAKHRRHPRTQIRFEHESEPQPKVQRRMPGEGASLIYWAMAIAGAFILGYALARLSA